MTATSVERDTQALSPTDLKPADYPVLAATKILKGTLFVIDADGYAKPGVTATDLFCAGRAKCTVDNTDGASGDLRVEAEEGVFRWVNGDSITLAHVGDPAFVADNQTVYKTGTGKSFAGVIRKVDSQGVWVETSMALSAVYAIGAGDYTTLTSNLASTSDGDGAALVGIEDDGNFTEKTNVEEALQELYQHLFSAVGGYIPIPLSAFREVNSTGDVGDVAAIGGVLASDTTPIYDAVATSNEHEIKWVADDVAPIGVSIALPRDFDDTADATLDIEVSSGSTDAATIVCASTWSAGAAGTEVSDSTSDSGTKSATPHRLSITIAAGDIPTGARRVSIRLTPPSHSTNAISLYAAGIAYKRKLLTS